MEDFHLSLQVSFCKCVSVSIDNKRRSQFSVSKIQRLNFSKEFIQQFFRHTYRKQTDLHWMLAKAKSTMENPSTSHSGNVIIAKVTYLNSGFDL